MPDWTANLHYRVLSGGSKKSVHPNSTNYVRTYRKPKTTEVMSQEDMRGLIDLGSIAWRCVGLRSAPELDRGHDPGRDCITGSRAVWMRKKRAGLSYAFSVRGDPTVQVCSLGMEAAEHTPRPPLR